MDYQDDEKCFIYLFNDKGQKILRVTLCDKHWFRRQKKKCKTYIDLIVFIDNTIMTSDQVKF